MTPRKAAHQALTLYLQKQRPLLLSLEQWQKEQAPSSQDFAFAYELTTGTLRRLGSLQYLIGKLAKSPLHKLRYQEQALLYLGFYQLIWMDRIPDHAVLNETIQLAKKCSHMGFSRFVGGILRAYQRAPIPLPEKELATLYSVPPFYAQALLEAYGEEKARTLLQASLQKAPLTARLRPGCSIPETWKEKLEQLSPSSVKLKDPSQAQLLSQEKWVYIQDQTPIQLVEALSEGLAPTSLLDLCAAPGGKLLAAHDAFPQAELFANDLSPQKLQRIRENLQRFGLSCHLTEGRGEVYPTERSFDLVIADLPCSNTGVLYKRPEARWRLEAQQLNQLKEMQQKLLAHSAQLLEPGGALWLMTCSILPEENEHLAQWAVETLSFELKKSVLHLPEPGGRDGGFGALLIKKMAP